MRALALADARAAAAEAGVAALQAKLADQAAGTQQAHTLCDTAAALSPGAADCTDALSVELQRLRERLAARDAGDVDTAQQSLCSAVAKLHANGNGFASSLSVRTSLHCHQPLASLATARLQLLRPARDPPPYLPGQVLPTPRSPTHLRGSQVLILHMQSMCAVGREERRLPASCHNPSRMQSLASSRIGTSFNASASDFPSALAHLASGSPAADDATALRQECAALIKLHTSCC